MQELVLLSVFVFRLWLRAVSVRTRAQTLNPTVLWNRRRVTQTAARCQIAGAVTPVCVASRRSIAPSTTWCSLSCSPHETMSISSMRSSIRSETVCFCHLMFTWFKANSTWLEIQWHLCTYASRLFMISYWWTMIFYSMVFICICWRLSYKCISQLEVVKHIHFQNKSPGAFQACF